MNRASHEEDEAFELAYRAWRQFFGFRLDRPAPTQPEIDARLIRYRRAHEAGSLAAFAEALVLVAGIAHALTGFANAVATITDTAEVLVFLLTCGLLLGVATQALNRARAAFETRALAQRIDVDTLDPRRVESMFADVRDPEVREYLSEVNAQGRRLRRAEAAVALDRGRGARGPDDVSREGFSRAIRGRSGTRPREIAIAAACLLSVVAVRGPGVDPPALLPLLYLLGGVALARVPYAALQLALDPWGLAGGGRASRRLRYGLATDMVPQLAVFFAVVATAAALAGWAA